MDTADILSYFFGAAQAVVQLFGLRKIFSPGSNIFPAILFTVINAAAISLPIPFFIGLIISLSSVILCCRFAFCLDRYKALLYGALSAEIMWLSCGMLDSLLSVIDGLINTSPSVGIIFLCAGNILPLAAYCVILPAACKIIKNEQVRNITIILLPLLLIFIVELYIVKVLYNAADTSSAIGGDIELLLVQLLGMASVFCILFAYKRCADNFRMSEKIQLYDRERRYSEQYANDVRSYYDTAKSLRHDFKNHILIIGELLKKEQYSQAAGYVSELNKACESTELKFRTGCPILDIILTEKLSALADKATVNCAAVPKIGETDICVIFANAVDNAVSAVLKLSDDERFIKITTKSRGELLFIEFENSFDSKPFEVGTGINNIIAAAERYGGTAQISTCGNIFSLKMILCNSQH